MDVCNSIKESDNVLTFKKSNRTDTMNKDIRKIFYEVSHTYELTNHILTFGLDIVWRRKATEIAAKEGGTMWLDVCTGTGETAFYLHRLAKKETTVVATDFCIPMLYKAIEKFGAHQVFFSLADAMALPFRNETFDLVTISFATRNININQNILLGYFREFYRILKPGGRFVNMETSQPPSNLLRKLFHLYVGLAVRPIGYIISGSRDGYAYLSQTIPRFYRASNLANIIRNAGFIKVDFYRMTFGLVAIHKAIKR